MSYTEVGQPDPDDWSMFWKVVFIAIVVLMAIGILGVILEG